MRVFFAMDSDGTVKLQGGEVGFNVSENGIIPIDLLTRLSVKHKVMVIGNSWLQSYGFDGARTRDGQPIPGIAIGKSALLRQWKTAYPGYDRYVVIDDRPEQYLEGWDGWEFMLPTRFLDEFGGGAI